ncbi:hypothetical protein D1872_250470 [compost metagenome]
MGTETDRDVTQNKVRKLLPVFQQIEQNERHRNDRQNNVLQGAQKSAEARPGVLQKRGRSLRDGLRELSRIKARRFLNLMKEVAADQAFELQLHFIAVFRKVLDQAHNLLPNYRYDRQDDDRYQTDDEQVERDDRVDPRNPLAFKPVHQRVKQVVDRARQQDRKQYRF